MCVCDLNGGRYLQYSKRTLILRVRDEHFDVRGIQRDAKWVH